MPSILTIPHPPPGAVLPGLRALRGRRDGGAGRRVRADVGAAPGLAAAAFAANPGPHPRNPGRTGGPSVPRRRRRHRQAGGGLPARPGGSTVLRRGAGRRVAGEASAPTARRHRCGGGPPRRHGHLEDTDGPRVTKSVTKVSIARRAGSCGVDADPAPPLKQEWTPLDTDGHIPTGRPGITAASPWRCHDAIAAIGAGHVISQAQTFLDRPVPASYCAARKAVGTSGSGDISDLDDRLLRPRIIRFYPVPKVSAGQS